ncbi:hypothetical protein GON03_18990 [Nocardioides sp. MAH-18]|uniref:Uncharacterized protein n=1 Tax=Nocardioides agri TaxID=2682843 RepID=A0A6L6XWW8_9ACTN|nr:MULTISPECIES: hypothetical protein [unclassified Nocardioides]MBA2952103.1 hypothetical protein [Nocardioides sp. CGMCC 1.13656]MVQ51272.1 hypothetical protein [Nocardioides sp. MAH-18]
MNPYRHLLTLRPWQRHSLVLAVAGAVYVCIGLSYIFSEATPSREASLQLAISWMPLPAWGGVWILVGLLAILSSRWPPASETWGYTTMTGLSAGWAAFYAVGIIMGAPHQGISGVLAWGLVAFLWWAISGLVNPGAD